MYDKGVYQDLADFRRTAARIAALARVLGIAEGDNLDRANKMELDAGYFAWLVKAYTSTNR